MIIVTTEFVPGKEIRELRGLVRGSSIQSKHIGKDITAALKTMVGGEIEEYNEMMEQARQVAIDKMVKDANAKGANAIIGMRLVSSAVMTNAANVAEIIVYGTAVTVE